MDGRTSGRGNTGRRVTHGHPLWRTSNRSGSHNSRGCDKSAWEMESFWVVESSCVDATPIFSPISILIDQRLYRAFFFVMSRRKIHPERKHGILFESQRYDVIHRKWKHSFYIVKGSFNYSVPSNKNSESKFFSISTVLPQCCQCDVMVCYAHRLLKWDDPFLMCELR